MEYTITDIEKLTETEVQEIALEAMEIKGFNVYFVNLAGRFGYSCLVFKNNHHIRYADDYQLHHEYTVKEQGVEALRDMYIKSLNHKLYTEEEIKEPLKDYDEYSAKAYFLHNYYGMQVDHISMFFNNNSEEAANAYRESIKGKTFNPIAFAYMDDVEFIKHHIELYKELEKVREDTDENYEYQKYAFLQEMYNHEYGINWQADYDTLSAFGHVEWHGENDDALEKYFDELKFNDIQKKAYRDARTEYYQKNQEMY